MDAHRAITDTEEAGRLFAPLAGAPCEMVAIAYLDPEWRLLGLRHIAGDHGRVRPRLRLIVRDALAFDAATTLLAHNHPSGDPTPSREDIAFTRTCAQALSAIGVTLTDHLILVRNGSTSFRDAGLL